MIMEVLLNVVYVAVSTRICRNRFSVGIYLRWNFVLIQKYCINTSIIPIIRIGCKNTHIFTTLRNTLVQNCKQITYSETKDGEASILSRIVDAIVTTWMFSFASYVSSSLVRLLS